MAALAIALMEQVADAQNARNSCFPEAIASPVVGLLLMAVTAALDHWTLSGDNPIRALSLTLVQMLAVIGPLAAESTAAMAEGDFSWTEGSDQPSMQEIAQSMTELRTELELATDSMVRWRLEKDTESGTRADRRMYSAILAIEEMRYYDIPCPESHPVDPEKLPVAHADCADRAYSGQASDGHDRRPTDPMTPMMGLHETDPRHSRA